MALPKSFTEKYLKKSEGVCLFGQKITELTRDELIASTVAGWEREAESRKEGLRMVNVMKSLRH